MHRFPVDSSFRPVPRPGEFRAYLRTILWLGMAPLLLILVTLLLSAVVEIFRYADSGEADLPVLMKGLSIAAILSPVPLALAYLHLLAGALFSATLTLRQFAWLLAGAIAFLAILLAIVGEPLVQVM